MVLLLRLRLFRWASEFWIGREVALKNGNLLQCEVPVGKNGAKLLDHRLLRVPWGETALGSEIVDAEDLKTKPVSILGGSRPISVGMVSLREFSDIRRSELQSLGMGF